MFFPCYDQILFTEIIFKEQIVADDNITTSTVSVPTEQMSVVYTGKWSVFNDPKFDQRLIPEDEKEKEGLRIGLLVTDLVSFHDVEIGGKLNVEKLVTYYYTEHTNYSVPLHICQPIQFKGSPMFYYCLDYTKKKIEEYDSRGTFQYIWRYKREEFISNIIVLAIISLTGVFGEVLFKPTF